MQSKTLEFRAAVCAGNLREADRLLDDLRREVELLWSNAAAAERQSIATQTFELLTWARQTVLARRSHAQRKLGQMMRQGAYSAPLVMSNRRIEWEG
jgi:hypothetical protein